MAEARPILHAKRSPKTAAQTITSSEYQRGRNRSGKIAAFGHNRGNWHSFEPVAAAIQRYVDALALSAPRYLRQLAEIALTWA